MPLTGASEQLSSVTDYVLKHRFLRTAFRKVQRKTYVGADCVKVTDGDKAGKHAVRTKLEVLSLQPGSRRAYSILGDVTS